MKKIGLNPFALDLLTKANWFVEEERYKSVNLTCASEMGKAEKWLSADYLKHIMKQGAKHDGYPEAILSHSLGINNLSFAYSENNIVEKAERITKRLAQVNTLLQTNIAINGKITGTEFLTPFDVFGTSLLKLQSKETIFP